MIFYRLECKNGTRPFDKIRELDLYQHFYSNHTPTPWNDNKLSSKWENLHYYEQTDYLFACQTKELLKEWFFSENVYKHMKNKGFIVKVIQVRKKYHLGERQCIFHEDEMKVLEAIPYEKFK